MLRRVLMIAGEASGDLHGSGIVRELKRRQPQIDVFGIGGDKMQGEGMDLIFHITGLAFMGFVEVVRNLPTIRRVERRMRELLDSRRPDVVVLIDYPGFNLRFARQARQRGIPVLYFISPQVWAWNMRRVKKMKRYVDSMKVVFPFEVEIYRKENIDVEFVGHPLAETLEAPCSREEFFRTHGLDARRKVLGLFPGSRMQEIEKILPVMLAAADELRKRYDLQVAVGVAPNLGAASIAPYLQAFPSVVALEHATHDLMCWSDAAIVTSGTATLETGWFGTPMVVVYRTSPVTFFIGRLLVDVPYIGLVNIVAGKKVVPEFIQHDMTAENLIRAIEKLLEDPSYAENVRRELGVVRQKLGGPGASARVVDGILALVEAA
jgi:lipid-A-disaccharide synthase